jgi:DNA primase
VDAVLGVIALAPELTDQAGALKRELMITRVAQRLGVKEETVWARLKELRAQRRPAPDARQRDEAAGPKAAPAAAHERELLQILLAEPALVADAAREVPSGEVEHPGLRLLLEGLYRLLAEGAEPGLELLRLRIDNPPLIAKALELQDLGRDEPDRRAWLGRVLDRFRERRALARKQELHSRLSSVSDAAAAVELLRQLQQPPTGGEIVGP